jgi:hypothetical protein
MITMRLGSLAGQLVLKWKLLQWWPVSFGCDSHSLLSLAVPWCQQPSLPVLLQSFFFLLEIPLRLVLREALLCLQTRITCIIPYLSAADSLVAREVFNHSSASPLRGLPADSRNLPTSTNHSSLHNRQPQVSFDLSILAQKEQIIKMLFL